MKFWKNVLLFIAGGAGYVGLELLWRRRSHSSMFFLGGACFLALGRLRSAHLPSGIPRCVVGSGIITAMEFAAGRLVNRQHQVWNYCDLPYNFLGQICLPFSLLWIPIASLGMRLHGRLSRILNHSVSASSCS